MAMFRRERNQYFFCKTEDILHVTLHRLAVRRQASNLILSPRLREITNNFITIIVNHLSCLFEN